METILLLLSSDKQHLIDSIVGQLKQKLNKYDFQPAMYALKDSVQSESWVKISSLEAIGSTCHNIWIYLPENDQITSPGLNEILTAAENSGVPILLFTSLQGMEDRIPASQDWRNRIPSIETPDPNDELEYAFYVRQVKKTNPLKFTMDQIHDLLVRIIHPIRLFFLPSGTKREEVYYQFRLLLRKIIFFLPDNAWRVNTIGDFLRWTTLSIMDILGKWDRRSMILPRWWLGNQNPEIYQKLDIFWDIHQMAPINCMYITGSSINNPNSRSSQIASAIQDEDIPLVLVPFRFSVKDDLHTPIPSDGNIFILPLDRLWAHPDQVFHSSHAPSGRRRMIIDFPHPALFRIITIARQNGWEIIYDSVDDWTELQRKGLANWYSQWFEQYLLTNVNCSSAIPPLLVLRPDRKEKLLIQPMPNVEKTRHSKTSHLVPNWWTKSSREETSFSELSKFIHTQPSDKGCVLIISGVQFTKSEGQRSTWLTRAFGRMGIPVIFVYFRFSSREYFSQDPDFPNIYQFPLDQLWSYPEEFINLFASLEGERILLAEFPHPALVRLLNIFNQRGWKTIYEVIDNWSEFSKVGQADWYDQNVETYIFQNTQLISATSSALWESAKTISGREVHLIQNAYESGSFPQNVTPRDLPCGKLTIGYFGHLTSSWFDWNLIVKTAQAHPDWMFHIIGYGYDLNMTLPSNILLPGKINHEDLPSYAANWNLAIIPFKITELSRGVDPIKVYEYLELRLPVVSCGMPHLTRMPYVQNAQTSDDFEKLILEASQITPDPNVIQNFLSKNTWKHRAENLLHLTNQQT